MLIHSCLALIALSLLFSKVAAQNIQTNNQGVIINMIVPRPRPEQHLYHPDNTFQANVMEVYRAQQVAEQQARADRQLEQIQARAANSQHQNSLGEALLGGATYRAVQAFMLHSSLQFEAIDALGWSIPAGTRFRFVTAYGSGGHAEIQLLGLQVAIPAEHNGFVYAPGVRSNGYVQRQEMQWELAE